MKKIFSIILLVVFTIFFILLIFENGDPVTFNFYFVTIDTKLYWIITLPFLIGLLCGVLIMSLSVMRNKLKVGKTKRQLNKVEKEVQNLRAAPMTAPMIDES
jgi:uncharacterized membrane protein YciS (DUF1049 family)